MYQAKEVVECYLFVILLAFYKYIQLGPTKHEETFHVLVPGAKT